MKIKCQGCGRFFPRKRLQLVHGLKINDRVAKACPECCAKSEAEHEAEYNAEYGKDGGDAKNSLRL